VAMNAAQSTLRRIAASQSDLGRALGTGKNHEFNFKARGEPVPCKMVYWSPVIENIIAANAATAIKPRTRSNMPSIKSCQPGLGGSSYFGRTDLRRLRPSHVSDLESELRSKRIIFI